MIQALIYADYMIIGYFLIMAFGYTVLLCASFPEVIRKFEEVAYGNVADLMHEETVLPVSIIIPAYNEEDRILNAVYSALNSDYANIQIIISCDGSRDNTLPKLIKTFNLYETPIMLKNNIKTAEVKRYFASTDYPNIKVIDKVNGQVADAVNAGLNICRTSLYMTLDADTVMKPNAVSRLVFTYLSNPDCILVGGAVYVLNGNKVSHGKLLTEPRVPHGYVTGFQCNEYLSSFLFGRAGWSYFGGALCYSGAFTLFDTRTVIAAGGHDKGNFSHDAEITIKLHQYMRDQNRPYKISYNPSAIAWTEVPGSLKAFWRQRGTWQRGLLCSFWEHKQLGLFYRYGIVGCVSFPFYVLFEVFGPVVEFIAYMTLLIGCFYGLIGYPVLLFIGIAWAYFVFIMMASILLNLITFNIYRRKMDILRMFLFAVINLFGFRQFMVLSYVRGTVQYFWNRLRGRKL